MSHTTSIPTRSFGFYLNGNWHTHGREVVITSPFDHSIVAVVCEANCRRRRDRHPVRRRSFRRHPQDDLVPARHYSAQDRRRHSRTASEEFARTICQEAGKPIKVARLEVDRGIYTFEVAAEEASRIYGEYIPLDTLEATAGRWGLMRRFPLGPVFAITPFNFPLEPRRPQSRSRHRRRMPAQSSSPRPKLRSRR